MKKILNYGSLNIDHVYQVEHFVSAGETSACSSLIVNCGGKGLNQSIAASKAGANVYHAGKIGIDGNILKEELEKNGVDTSFLCQCNTPNGHAVIQVDSSGQNCILIFAGSNNLNTAEEVDNCLAHFDEGDYIILQNEINLIPYIIDKAYAKKMKIVFNPSPITPDINLYPIDKVSLLILNEVEGTALSGEDEPDKIISKLRSKYKNTDILLTLGSKGSIFSDGKNTIRHGVYKTNIVDTTAAGDTVTGYFVACIANGYSAEEALKTASRAASLTISRSGAAQSIPTADEVRNSTFILAE